jgi:hypothetical protein
MGLRTMMGDAFWKEETEESLVDVLRLRMIDSWRD